MADMDNTNQNYDFSKVFEEFDSNNARASIIIVGSSVELLLELLIKKYLGLDQDDDLNQIGLTNFVRKIVFARKFQLIDNAAEEAFQGLRDVRNEFAHKISVELESPDVQKGLDKIRKYLKFDENQRYGYGLIKPDTNPEINELRFMGSCLIYYLRYIVFLTCFHLAPSNAFNFIDICNNAIPVRIHGHKEEKTVTLILNESGDRSPETMTDKALLFGDGMSCADIQLEEATLEFLKIDVVFQVRHDSFGRMLTLCAEGDEQLISITKLKDDNSFDLIFQVSINGTLAHVCKWHTVTYKNTLQIVVSDRILALNLNGQEYKQCFPVQPNTRITVLRLARGIAKYGGSLIFGIFELEICDKPGHAAIFKYSSKSKEDNKALTTAGVLQGMTLKNCVLSTMVDRKLF